MKTLIASIVASVVFLLTPSGVHADDFSLGAGVAAGSTQVQGELDLSHRASIQGGLGQLLFYDALNASVGARYYLSAERVSPYVGGLYSLSWWDDNDRLVREEHVTEHLGPTVGARFLQRRHDGLGAFVELEILHYRDEGQSGWHPAIGAGVNWRF